VKEFLMTSKTMYQVDEGFRLSPQQKRVWRLHAMHAGMEFGVQCITTIRGPLDPIQMSRAIARIRSRHEILRTSFVFLEGISVPVQRIDDPPAELLEIVDLSDKDKKGRASQITDIAGKQWNLLQKPVEAPAVSFGLMITAQDEHVLLITISGLCADAVSSVQIVHEIQEAYFSQDNEVAEVPQYADLAEWQNQLLENADAEGHNPYWKSPEFSDLGFPGLPFELRHTTDISALRFETLRSVVPAETASALGLMAQQLHVPLQAILLSAWQMVLHRLSAKERFLVGVALDGRVQAELHNAIGLFAKVLPISVQLQGNPRFSELVEQTHNSLTIAQYDQQLFDGESFATPDASQRRILFPLIFSIRENTSTQLPGGHGWEFQLLAECLEPFELSLNAVTTAEEHRLEFAWDISIFSRIDISLISQSYTALLKEIVKAPDSRINDFTMSRAGDYELLAAISNEERPWRPVHSLIEDQVRRVPERLALICEDDQITYAELDRRASVLENRLREAGAVPDSVVAIIAERSVDFAVGIFSVLKAGAAWLPIEPDTPAARIHFMIKDAGAVAILTQKSLKNVDNFSPLPVLYLDDYRESSVALVQPPAAVAPQHRAYVIFTSGSTGRPKGVAIEHRQFSAYVQGEAIKLRLDDCSHFALVSTFAADLGHSTVFGALTTGASLHVIPAWRAADAEALAQYFLHHPVDFIKIVPAHLDALCRSLPESARLPWRCLLVGGELLTRNLVELAQRFAPDCAVVNHYGPTETTVGVFCGEVTPESERFSGPNVAIGSPWPGTTDYLLDEQLRMVPAWMPGGLYIGGDSVGRGYVGRGALTAERFIPDPFHPKHGSRMYYTGDFARYRSDGQVEFIGRRDGQVKIRGYRVEPGEVEEVLCRHPQVHNAAVVAVDRVPGGKQLVAWVAVGSTKITAEDLRHFVEMSLPSYMVPANFVCVDRLILTPNGKVDRQALPAEIPIQATIEFLEPMDEMEENLVSIWKKVLGVDRIGVADNYFALGGDSLRVVQLVHEARHYGITIAAADVLRHQTIRRLRKALQAKLRHGLFPDGVPPLESPTPEVLKLLPADVVDVYPVSGIQSFILEKHASSTGSRGIYHIQDCFHIHDASFSLAALEAALHAVVDRHPALRTVFDLQSVPPMQWVRCSLNWRMETEDISLLPLTAQEDRISIVLRDDRACSFDPADRETPFFRVRVFLRGTTEFDLMFSCHHAIMDGWGHRVLHNQLVRAYISAKLEEKIELGVPDNTYREFVAFQEAVRTSDRAAGFWKSYLNGLQAPELAPDPAPGQESDDSFILHHFDLEMSLGLMRAARSHAASMQALMLAAWLETLRAWSAEQLVVTGVIVSGRSEHLTDPLSAVGLFWNIVPLVSRATLPFPELLAQLQKDLIEMEPYSAYPLPQLQADQGGRELFFTVFRYLNFWNAREIPEESGVQVLSARSYDRYSYPLLCSAVIHANSSGGYLQLEYDPQKISLDRAADVMDRYVALLQKIAADSGQQ
jgi:amino acid adenylation domain-containing protein